MKGIKGFLACMLLLCVYVLTPRFSYAEEIPLIITNTSSHDVSMAVSYHDLKKRVWVTAGWVAIPANSTLTKIISTGSLTVYYYAFSEDGTIYQGSKDNLKDKALVVSDAPFTVKNGTKPLQGSLSTRYFKFKRGDASLRKIHFNF